MIRLWLPILLLALLPMAVLSGCSRRSVEYSTTGEAHCPKCKARLPARIVRCTRCDTRLRWAIQEQTCWHCEGLKTCPVCEGSGETGGEDRGKKCYACDGEGECPDCNSYGMIEYDGGRESGGS